MFGKGTLEGTRPLLPPGTCWICDMSPTQEEMRVIDTRRNARPGGPTSHASVRKYICEPCALEMGGAMGMVKAEEYEAALHRTFELDQEAHDLAARLTATEAHQVRVVAADEISDVISETIRAELAKQARPTPRKRAAASDE